MRTLSTTFGLIGLLTFGGCQTHKPAQSAPAVAPATRVTDKPLHYLNIAEFDVDAALPAPPTDRGTLSRGEAELMLAIQGEGSEAARARSRAEDKIQVWNYADVLGSGFTRSRLPQTEALLRKVDQDAGQVTMLVKQKFARARPPVQDDRIKTLFPVPSSASYPSGHAIHAMIWARVLSLVAPEKEQELLQRARLVAYDRVIAGVHFPTDVAAGMGFANLLMDEFVKSPAFQADLAKARDEWQTLKQ